MKRKRLAAALLVPLVLVLAACAPSAGVVHDKRFDNGGSYLSCSGSGSSHHCSYVDDPPSWALDLYASNGKHGWKNVTEKEYESVGVGDYFDSKAAH